MSDTLLIVCLGVASMLPVATVVIAKVLGRDRPDKRPSITQSIICVILWAIGVVFLGVMNVYGGIRYYEDTAGASGNAFYMYWFVSFFVILISGIALWSAIFDERIHDDALRDARRAQSR